LHWDFGGTYTSPKESSSECYVFGKTMMTKAHLNQRPRVYYGDDRLHCGPTHHSNVWTRHTCKRSRVGRLLARFFCLLLINSPLGINAQWISTVDNVIADNISRVKKASNIDLSLSFDYTTLKQTYPELSHCSFFQIQPELILLIWDIMLTKKWPTHEEVQILKRRPLGRLII
jgi:hypothetical protein